MPETSKSPGEGQKDTGRRWPLFVGLPFIVLVAVAALLFSGGGQSPGTGGQEQPSGTEDRPADSDAGEQEGPGGGSGLGTPALGSADAPVVMTEYGDFQ